MEGGLLHRSNSILMVLTPFYSNLSENFDFSGTAYHRDLKQVLFMLNNKKDSWNSVIDLP